MWSLEIQPHVVYPGETEMEQKLLTIAPTRSSGGGGRSDFVQVEISGTKPYTLSNRWAPFSFTRFPEEQMGLAYMLDIF